MKYFILVKSTVYIRYKDSTFFRYFLNLQAIFNSLQHNYQNHPPFIAFYLYEFSTQSLRVDYSSKITQHF